MCVLQGGLVKYEKCVVFFQVVEAATPHAKSSSHSATAGTGFHCARLPRSHLRIALLRRATPLLALSISQQGRLAGTRLEVQTVSRRSAEVSSRCVANERQAWALSRVRPSPPGESRHRTGATVNVASCPCFRAGRRKSRCSSQNSTCMGSPCGDVELALRGRLGDGAPLRASAVQRIVAAKRLKKVEHVTAIIWRLLRVAEQLFRKLNAPEQCKDVFHGTRYEDGVVLPAHPSAPNVAA